jgi:imidazolonepropionase-like amidohydrolase
MNQPLIIVADKLFDGMRFRDARVKIVVEGGLIEQIAPLEGEPLEPPAAAIDARGKLVMPGLINAHTHIVRGGMFKPDEALSIPQAVRNLWFALRAGQTTVADLGCAPGLIYALREHLKRRPAGGPQLVAVGPLLTAPGGYPLDWMPALNAKLGVAIGCDSPEACRRAVRRTAKAGADFIKLVVMHRSYADRPIPTLDEPRARALVDEAHRLGRKVLVHAHSNADYRVALRAGADALMHSSFEPLEPDALELVVGSGVPVCPTISVFESALQGVEQRWDRDPRRTKLVSPAIRREWSAFCDAFEKSGDALPAGIAGGLPKARARESIVAAVENLRMLHERGVPIVFGTDSNYGFCLTGLPGDELAAMNRCGLDIRECLRAATSNAARLLGLGDRGVLAEGKRADLIVVDAAVERDVRAIESVAAVIAGGSRVDIDRPSAGFAAGLGVATAMLRGVAAALADAAGFAPADG